MSRWTQIGAFFRRGWRRISTGTVRRAERMRRNIHVIGTKEVGVRGLYIPMITGFLGLCVLMLIVGVVGIFFPEMLFAIYACIRNYLTVRILLIIVTALTFFWCGALCWWLVDLIAHSDEEGYAAGVFHIYRGALPDDLFDEFDESFYEPYEESDDIPEGPLHDLNDPLFETIYDGWDSSEEDDEPDESASEENSATEPEKTSEAAEKKADEQETDERETPKDFRRMSHVPPYHHRFGAYRAPHDRFHPQYEQEDDIRITAEERVIEGQGRVVLKYTRQYVEELIARAINECSDQLWVVGLEVNFQRDAFEIELSANAAADADHAQLADKLHQHIRKTLGGILQNPQIVLSLTVCGVVKPYRRTRTEAL